MLRKSNTRSGGRRHGQRGQSLLEFALVLPIFLLFVMGTVDFGWALRNYITATNAAREGARYGVTGAISNDIKSRVVARSSGLLQTSDVKVCRGTTCDSGLSNTDSSTVIVKATYTYKFITPLGSLAHTFSGGLLPDSLPLNSATSMRME
ncbi:MAG TPA: TadE/TadG family type IV pilus assembly protein [Dehalococcoidia bacterium]|jgi:Flp pilus assembly protein TadG